jgi:error-prone DNA polymerase
MGFYHPATLVKDAQRRGVCFAPIDVQQSDWECRVEPDGRVRLGLMYVNGLRAETGKRIARDSGLGGRRSALGGTSGNTAGDQPVCCPKCGCDDHSMLETTPTGSLFCNICASEWSASPERRTPSPEPRAPSAEPRYRSIDHLIAQTALRRDELATLAEIGALNAFGCERRSALWQIERAIRPAGKLFEEGSDTAGGRRSGLGAREVDDDWRLESRIAPVSARTPNAERRTPSPLRPMSPAERLKADYSGTSLTIGPHPMALCRGELALRGVQRAMDLPRGRSGRRVRVAGAVITRQRPGTAKGFVFLTLEDETGIANIIVRPDLFLDQRTTIVGAPYLLVEGILQIQEGVTSVKAERMQSLATDGPEPQSHDFR